MGRFNYVGCSRRRCFCCATAASAEHMRSPWKRQILRSNVSPAGYQKIQLLKAGTSNQPYLSTCCYKYFVRRLLIYESPSAFA